MKAEITQNKKAFEPIEVKITIESLEELVCLISSLNTTKDAKNESRLSDFPTISFLCNQRVWYRLGQPLLKIYETLK